MYELDPIQVVSTLHTSHLEVSLVLRARLPPPVAAVQLVAARRLEELGADDDVVVDRRRLFQRVEALGGRGRRQLGCHGPVRRNAVTEVFSQCWASNLLHLYTLEGCTLHWSG